MKNVERFDCEDFSLELPEDWYDATEDMPEGSPFTFCQSDESGALQVTLALYQSGKIPDPSLDVLVDMVREFGVERALGKPFDIASYLEPIRAGAASFNPGDHFIRVWYVSDGRNFAVVTYVDKPGQPKGKVAECERIVQSFRFTVEG